MAEKYQQYPGTEYIQPPISPLALDAKKSPLALLAQTCSAIGKEPLSSAHKPFPLSSALKPSDGFFRKASVICTSPASNLPRVPTASPALSEGRVDRLKQEKSPRNPMSFHNSSLQSLSDLANYTDPSKFHASNSPVLSAFSDRRKSQASNCRKRKSFIQPETSERKMSKSDSLHSRQKTSNSPGGSYTANHYNLSTATEMPRSAAKACSPSHHAMPLYDSYCMGCQVPHVGGNVGVDPLKSVSFPFYSFGSPASAYPLYAQMLMSASRNTGSPPDLSQYVCNWVNHGAGTCGKKFSSAEELSNHLRTHVTTPNNAGVNHFANTLEKLAATPFAAAYLSQAAALAAASSSIPSGILPRSHSPLSGYPYKANMLSQFTGSLPPMPIAAGVGPYSSPYALYGPKLNPAAAGYCYP